MKPTPEPLGADVCRALGLEPNEVTSLTLRFTPQRATAEVVQFITLDPVKAGEISVVLRRYELTPVAPEVEPCG
jgi:hypothetical protein